MPFDYKEYDAKCATMGPDALQLELNHYNRALAGAGTSAFINGCALPFTIPITMGASLTGVGVPALIIENAREKREIVKRHLQSYGITPHTRKRDIVTGGVISGSLSSLALGMAPMAADSIISHAAEHGISSIIEHHLAVHIGTHLAADAMAVSTEETSMGRIDEEEAQKWKLSHQLPQGAPLRPINTNPREILSSEKTSYFPPSEMVYRGPINTAYQQTPSSQQMSYFPPRLGVTAPQEYPIYQQTSYFPLETVSNTQQVPYFARPPWVYGH